MPHTAPAKASAATAKTTAAEKAAIARFCREFRIPYRAFLDLRH